MDIFDFAEDVLNTEHPHSLDNIIKLMNHFGLADSKEVNLRIHGDPYVELYIDFFKGDDSIHIVYKTPNYGISYYMNKVSMSKVFKEVRTFRYDS